MKFFILTELKKLRKLLQETFIMTRQVHSKLDTVLAQLEAAAQRHAAEEAQLAELKALIQALPPGTTGSPELLDAVTRIQASVDKSSAHIDEIESAVTDTASQG